MGAQRNSEKWCTFGNGQWADPTRFFTNRAKPDGPNDICSYHQGKVEQRNKS